MFQWMFGERASAASCRRSSFHQLEPGRGGDDRRHPRLPFPRTAQVRDVSLGLKVAIGGKTMLFPETPRGRKTSSSSRAASIYSSANAATTTARRRPHDYLKLRENLPRLGCKQLLLTHMGEEMLARSAEIDLPLPRRNDRGDLTSSGFGSAGFDGGAGRMIARKPLLGLDLARDFLRLGELAVRPGLDTIGRWPLTGAGSSDTGMPLDVIIFCRFSARSRSRTRRPAACSRPRIAAALLIYREEHRRRPLAGNRSRGRSAGIMDRREFQRFVVVESVVQELRAVAQRSCDPSIEIMTVAPLRSAAPTKHFMRQPAYSRSCRRARHRNSTACGYGSDHQLARLVLRPGGVVLTALALVRTMSRNVGFFQA
jgi:hypothetical protein